MKIRAIGSHIMVKRLASPAASMIDPLTQVTGPIAVPDSWRAKSITGKVVSVGRGALTHHGVLVPHEVRSGDIITFDPKAGSEIKLGNDTYLILEEHEVHGIVG